jgi:hypothetical protein
VITLEEDVDLTNQMQIHHPKKCFTKELEHPDSALVD